MLKKFFGVIFGTLIVNHARSIWLVITTGTMKYTIGNSMVKKRIELGIRDFGRYNRVNLVSIMNLIILMQPNQNMDVW